MPRTFGDGIIHKSHFDFATEICEDLPLHETGKISDVETKIGKLIAENLVKDGATLQMGIGSIPDAVLNALHDHKDLGIHSEMFSNGVVDLFNKGCITNSRKSFHKGRMVGSFLVGDKKLYDFVDDNPFLGRLTYSVDNSFLYFAPFFRNAGHRICEQHQHCQADATNDCHQQLHRSRPDRSDLLGFDWNTFLFWFRWSS